MEDMSAPTRDNSNKPAAITFSRMSSPEVMRVRVVIEDAGTEILDLEMSLADFTLALTGRGDSPAKLIRRFHRP